mmetsp:Transcript_3292/g.7236  ORF Transcript_3292/g.7236 Transcript_3292/m.7236 type:complete len:447 (-) Transcript_3292:763-2103(-)|eukprot:CAMPEP_0201134904 /NCGR_PEP_ID=MMETSP0850-20130426/53093_1 /ASSEMBLY_ACC=CAM_ASM_000622 /TAXON_ID=183588 /ORGANISM="Pseudo-nitzschia fraudulenta, Strain WWA7" /LENGTH=446 /DNA_ID=CAMNT_0047405965 /DNA_START=79 /DNA_END=1419 /DNA_ORIENTATION=+
MGQPFSLLSTTNTFYSGLFYYLCGGGRHSPYELENGSTISSLKIKKTDSGETSLFKQHARIHLFSLSSVWFLYNKPHYRKGSYRDDLVDNLRNVAIPGTGIPLSIVAQNRYLGLLFLMTAYPAVSYVSAIHKWLKSGLKSSISEEYATRLLAPDDWFSYWRLNCNVVGLHSLLNDVPSGYEMENKWTFLDEGSKLGVPVSPFLKTPGIVVKHRNEEGGMGIHFFKNATAGGDWIIQETISNSDWVNTMLPSKAPLSTFRVITQSRASINVDEKPVAKDITALSCVFRAGRQGAATDHDSILFDVDVETGLIKGGTTNAHWYRLGLLQTLPGRCPWRSADTERYQTHPDGDIPVSGNSVPDIKGMLKLVEESHMKMCPDVPLAGWDVVFSADSKVPICLLEVNLSCNFFRGSFDKKVYLDFVDESFAKIQSLRLTADAEKKKFTIKS